jgi:UDPglucose--hexose-1-phosphate uridylyltransferase
MPELRKDPVLGQWVIIAKERGKRPSDYLSNLNKVPVERQPCSFCPGNEDQRLTYVAGFERGTGFYINPILPEEAARFLREAEKKY